MKRMIHNVYTDTATNDPIDPKDFQGIPPLLLFPSILEPLQVFVSQTPEEGTTPQTPLHGSSDFQTLAPTFCHSQQSLKLRRNHLSFLLNNSDSSYTNHLQLPEHTRHTHPAAQRTLLQTCASLTPSPPSSLSRCPHLSKNKAYPDHAI